jgi:hypothetical protein
MLVRVGKTTEVVFRVSPASLRATKVYVTAGSDESGVTTTLDCPVTLRAPPSLLRSSKSTPAPRTSQRRVVEPLEE